MDYAQIADKLITQALTASVGGQLETDEQTATVNALAGIGYALIHLAEVVGRLEQ